MDTLHLSVKHPHLDVYRRWLRGAEKETYRSLRMGVPAEGLVVRTGASGYRLSVWDGDARCYLTDQVDDVVGEGLGMGVWVQLGPRFLGCNASDLPGAVEQLLRRIGIAGKWPIRVTRLDLAVDLPGQEMGRQDLGLWQAGWVGRSRVSSVFFSSESGELETINIGVRSSGVFLRIYDKVAQAEKEGDLGHWRQAWGGYEGPVVRVEWQVRPGEGGFEDIRDFDGFSQEKLESLAIYLLAWGRLCVPDSSDSNSRRWELAPLWEHVGEVVRTWCSAGTSGLIRSGKELNDVSEGYVRFLSGAVSGAMARFNPNDPSWYALIKGLEDHGQETNFIERKAKEKGVVFRRLGLGGASSQDSSD